MTTIAIIICAITIIGLAINLWTTNTKLNNALDANTSLQKSLAKFREKYVNTRRLFKSTIIDIIGDKSIIVENTFPIISIDAETFEEIEHTSIRFKKVEDKVLIYVDGAIKPSANLFKIVGVTSINAEHKVLLENILKAIGQTDAENINTDILLEEFKNIEKN